VMLASIDSPQGDQADANAPTIAVAMPSPTSAVTPSLPDTGSDGPG
jgi:hypothetical protein